ncbi:hypothetical protein F4680DRAFT_309017 [Xylaria scruposa]|nr:hypothetical protein F4680DRAFT_309017 [Xylaria scruposa]
MLSFPKLPFLIGNDICRLARISRILQSRVGPRFVHRILRTEEIQHATTARILRCILEQSAQGSQDAQSIPKGVAEARDTRSFTRAVEFMAGRFAAKEAVIKAHPHRRLTFQRIAILRVTISPEGSVFETSRELGPRPNETSQGGPLVACIKADESGQRDMYASVSISHDTDYATAVCLGLTRRPRRYTYT